MQTENKLSHCRPHKTNSIRGEAKKETNRTNIESFYLNVVYFRFLIISAVAHVLFCRVIRLVFVFVSCELGNPRFITI